MTSCGHCQNSEKCYLRDKWWKPFLMCDSSIRVEINPDPNCLNESITHTKMPNWNCMLITKNDVILDYISFR